MKKTPIFVVFSFVLSLTNADAADVGQRVAVKGTRINLRAAADPVAEVVGQVSEPDTLILQGSVDDPWVKVTPPDNIDLWIFANLVDDNAKVNVKKALVRSGAGLNYKTVGELELGAPVTIRGKVGDWLKIAPFPTAAVWITNSYVELVAPAPVPQPETGKPAPAESAPLPEPARQPETVEPATALPGSQPEPGQPELAEVSHDTTAPVAPTAQAEPAPPGPISERKPGAPDNPDDPVGPAKVPASKLRAGVSQAGSGSYAGLLALSPAGPHPTPFRLVLFDADNNPSTVCYVLGNRKQLDTLKGQNFTIEGAVYWFEGTDLPTIFAQNILRHRGR